MVRESIMWRFDGHQLRFLICLPELVEDYKRDGWRPLGTIDEPPPNEIEEVRQEEIQKWVAQCERKPRRRRRRRPPLRPRLTNGSTGE